MALECSVVVPLCNEQENLPALHLRLAAVMRRLAIPYEIIYVDDGSTDRTPEIITGLHAQDSEVKGVFLSRNFGHQAALCAGLDAASGRAVVTVDGDLQDPPELIPELIDKWRDGYQIVFARRRRRRENLLKRAAYFTFYRLLRAISEVPIPLDTGDFALMDRQAVTELNNLPERTRFVRGLRSWVGFKQTEVLYDRDIRRGGQSKYTLRRLFKLALDGAFAFSFAPLKMVTIAGGVVSAGAIAVPILMMTRQWSIGPASTGLIWLGSALALLGGVQLIGLGILGEYLSRIYQEVRGRPLYVTRERIGFRLLPRPVPNVIEYLPREPSRHPERLAAARLDPSHAERLSLRDSGA